MALEGLFVEKAVKSDATAVVAPLPSETVMVQLTGRPARGGLPTTQFKLEAEVGVP